MRIWNEGLFEIGKTSIETLVKALREFDFAILVLTPDDRIGEGEVELFSPRDNVIFELGLGLIPEAPAARNVVTGPDG